MKSCKLFVLVSYVLYIEQTVLSDNLVIYTGEPGLPDYKSSPVAVCPGSGIHWREVSIDPKRRGAGLADTFPKPYYIVISRVSRISPRQLCHPQDLSLCRSLPGSKGVIPLGNASEACFRGLTTKEQPGEKVTVAIGSHNQSVSSPRFKVKWSALIPF